MHRIILRSAIWASVALLVAINMATADTSVNTQDSYTAMFKSARLLERQDDTAGATNIYNTIIATASDSAVVVKAYYMRGMLSFQRGDTDKAEQDFQKIFHDYPQDNVSLKAALLCGQILWDRNDVQNAATLYQQILTVSGSSETSYAAPAASFGLANCKEKTGDREGAMRLFGEIVQKWPRSLEAAMARRRLSEP